MNIAEKTHIEHFLLSVKQISRSSSLFLSKRLSAPVLLTVHFWSNKGNYLELTLCTPTLYNTGHSSFMQKINVFLQKNVSFLLFFYIYANRKNESSAAYFFLSFLSVTLWQIASLSSICLFNYFAHSFVSSNFFLCCLLSLFSTHYAQLSVCLMLVISPPGTNLAVIDPLISSALECQRNKP